MKIQSNQVTNHDGNVVINQQEINVNININLPGAKKESRRLKLANWLKAIPNMVMKYLAANDER
jgi:hypothetical protein